MLYYFTLINVLFPAIIIWTRINLLFKKHYMKKQNKSSNYLNQVTTMMLKKDICQLNNKDSKDNNSSK